MISLNLIVWFLPFIPQKLDSISSILSFSTLLLTPLPWLRLHMAILLLVLLPLKIFMVFNFTLKKATPMVRHSFATFPIYNYVAASDYSSSSS